MYIISTNLPNPMSEHKQTSIGAKLRAIQLFFETSATRVIVLHKKHYNYEFRIVSKKY